MTKKKILVADDSLTIQKVVAITLANLEDIEIVKCLSEKDLVSTVSADHFDLILLDVSLSESLSGYELAGQVTKVSPSTAILLMLGTFDQYDEEKGQLAGVHDFVVKPFEAALFVNKVTQIIYGEESPVDVLEVNDESEEIDSNDFDGWVVDAPESSAASFPPVIDNSDPLSVSQEKVTNKLSESALDWGIEIPDVIHQDETSSPVLFPPVIDKQTSSEQVQEGEVTGPNLVLEETGEDDQEQVEDQLREQELLADVEEETSLEDFWSVDNENSELKNDTRDLSPSLKANLDEDILVEKLLNKLLPILESKLEEKIDKIAREMCTSQIDRVAWEVIPDLAENLIKKEIKEISSSIN